MSAAWETWRPEWGIVLGSGLSGVVAAMRETVEVPYAEIGELPVSSVQGHAGRFVFGRLGEAPVLAAQGRVHLYEGRSGEEVAAHVRWMAARGVRRLVLTNAAGTLNPAFAPGSWMQLVDHLNLTGASPLRGPHFVDLSEVYSARLRAEFAEAARALGLALHAGVYAGLRGPQYETPAEIRMLRTLGADAVGMSTVLEAIAARALGLEVAGFSCLTNWAAGLGGAPLDHAEVLATGGAAGAMFARLFSEVARRSLSNAPDSLA